MKRLSLAALAALLMTTSLGAAQQLSAPQPSSDAEAKYRKVCGGGEVAKSEYSRLLVPQIINAMRDKAKLGGYEWCGPTNGTLDNAARVTDNPTHLALAQWDIIQQLNGQPIPEKVGETYAFTVVRERIGYECLYAVSKEKAYTTFGDIIQNAWALKVYTGAPTSGSYGTWKILRSMYPDLEQVPVEHVGGAADIISLVAQEEGVIGFFVMRPSANSNTFKALVDSGLSVIPVVHEGMDESYAIMTSRISHDGFFKDAIEHTTACTQIALITGDPASKKLVGGDQQTKRLQKRLQATIDRLRKLPEDAFYPDDSSWHDDFAAMRNTAKEKFAEFVKASREAITKK